MNEDTIPYMPHVDLEPGNGTQPENGQKLSNDEKRRRHQKVVRFFDEGGWDGMSIPQVAGALGVSNDSVRAEAKKRGAYAPRTPLSEHRRVQATLPATPKLAPGAVEKEMDDFFARYPGGMFTVNEIAEHTGMKVASIRTVLHLRGMVSERPPGAPANEFGKYRIPGEPADEGMDLTPREVRQVEQALAPEPEAVDNNSVTYVGRTKDGRLVGKVEGSDTLWTLKLGSPL